MAQRQAHAYPPFQRLARLIVRSKDEKQAGEPTAQPETHRKKKGAWRTNMEQALGASMLLWVLPLGQPPNEGLDFPMNPRFGPDGIWRKREQWPSGLQ